MKETDLILIVEDNLGAVRSIAKSLELHLNIEMGQILVASRISRAKELFARYKQNIVAVLMDGSVDTLEVLDTLPLSLGFREQGFDRPIVAMSSDSDFRSIMIASGGCSHNCPSKSEAGLTLLKIFSNDTQ